MHLRIKKKLALGLLGSAGALAAAGPAGASSHREKNSGTEKIIRCRGTVRTAMGAICPRWQPRAAARLTASASSGPTTWERG